MSNPEPTGTRIHPLEARKKSTPSDRGILPPTLITPSDARLPEEYLGVDMVRLRFPIEAPRATPREMATPNYSRIDLLGMFVFIWMYMASGKLMASVRFNPARHPLNPRIWGGCPIDLLPVIADQVWWEIQHFVAPKVALTEVEITRLDIARDFLLTSGERSAILTAASKVPVRYATRRHLWLSPKGTPQTLYASTKHQGGVRAYDHHARHGTSPEDTFRIEAQVHQKRLNKFRITHLTDLSPASIDLLYSERFDWSGFGTPAVYLHRRTEQIWSLANDPDHPLTPLQALRFLGSECLVAAGIDPTIGNSTAATHRALTRSLGTIHVDQNIPEIIRLHPAHDQPLRATA